MTGITFKNKKYAVISGVNEGKSSEKKSLKISDRFYINSIGKNNEIFEEIFLKKIEPYLDSLFNFEKETEMFLVLVIYNELTKLKIFIMYNIKYTKNKIIMYQTDSYDAGGINLENYINHKMITEFIDRTLIISADEQKLELEFYFNGEYRLNEEQEVRYLEGNEHDSNPYARIGFPLKDLGVNILKQDFLDFKFTKVYSKSEQISYIVVNVFLFLVFISVPILTYIFQPEIKKAIRVPEPKTYITRSLSKKESIEKLKVEQTKLINSIKSIKKKIKNIKEQRRKSEANLKYIPIKEQMKKLDDYFACKSRQCLKRGY